MKGKFPKNFSVLLVSFWGHLMLFVLMVVVLVVQLGAAGRPPLAVPFGVARHPAHAVGLVLPHDLDLDERVHVRAQAHGQDKPIVGQEELYDPLSQIMFKIF